MSLVGDFMDVFIVFKMIFSNIYDLLNRSIYLGQGIYVSVFGVFVGVAIISLLVAVCRRLYD